MYMDRDVIIFELAKERLSESVESYLSIQKKAGVVAGFIVATTTALVVNEWPKNPLILSIFTCCSVLSLVLLFDVLRSRKIKPRGYDPKALTGKAAKALNNDMFLSSLLDKLQNYISYNETKNSYIGTRLDQAIACFLIGIGLSLLLFVMTYFMHSSLSKSYQAMPTNSNSQNQMNYHHPHHQNYYQKSSYHHDTPSNKRQPIYLRY